ncbi:ankyrin repeat domain-containing protein [Aspergillus fijiensis CBS 313.89]|uniref:Ankyrin n=1 Tax=Aspergillus fijiensis CBS 313.89 TaxID=1448319 RepID=A0A8G1W384_9EURO|nr:ankyrin [Aspergillus fijiensis CBS 313.89]RAK82202.1 ankyrin [Aspergillus fijiensis CBS 313.89]
MSFGFGVGDFLATLQLADNLKKWFAQAPSGFKAISADVKSLWAVLHDLDDIPKDGLSVTQKAELDVIVQRGREVLLGIEGKLSKYNVLADLTADIGAEVHAMKDTHDAQLHSEMLAWISPIDTSERQRKSFDIHGEGTSDHALLCTGAPGAGKTILTSIAIDRLQKKHSHKDGIVIVYHYFHYQEQLGYSDILSSFLRQLIEASRGDVESFLDGNVTYLPEFLQGKSELWNYIRHQIIESAGGIFLLVRLYYTLLLDEKNEKGDAIAVVTGIDDIASVCCGLVVADKHANTTRMVHLTAQEYLNRTWQTWFPNMHEYLTNTCLTYQCRDQSNPFYSYAAHELGTHLRHSLGKNLLLMTFLENDFKVSRCMCEMFGLEAGLKFPGIHLAALLGLEDHVPKLIFRPGTKWADARDHLGRTPLIWAAAQGNSSVVSTLLRFQADINAETLEGFTPLFYAAAYGHAEMVTMLISWGVGGAGVQLGPESLFTMGDHALVAQLLLDAGSDVNHQNIRQETPFKKPDQDPLTVAARKGHVAITRLLLKNGAGDASLVRRILQAGCDPNPRDIFDRTPLFAAVCLDRAQVVKVLLDHHDIEIQIEDRLGYTPLQESYRRQNYGSYSAPSEMQYSAYSHYDRKKDPDQAQIFGQAALI